MRILLADDHTLFRAGIRSILERVPGVTVVAEAGDGREALDLLEEHRPDIALLDITMPGLNGLEVADRVESLSPGTKVIILSMHANEGYVAQALRAGVSGYILKDAASQDLELSLLAVARGETWLSPSISKQVVELFLRGDKPADDPLASLTARQREVLQLIAEGKSTKEIAFDLEISVKTVEAHRAQLMERLDIHDIPGLVRFAIRTGLVSPEA
jgi:NarL family two-component system response regulator LiaR